MSSKIKILDATMEELAVLNAVSSASRTEKINSDNGLNFSFPIKKAESAYIGNSTVFELDGDYFDTAYYKKEQQSDGRLIVSIEAEHISYRLNKAEYNVEYFTEIGTPTYIIGKILAGTGFTVGTIDFTAVTTFSLQKAASRRSLLMQFAAYLGAELEFDGFNISLLSQRGSSTPKVLTVGKDITVISKAVDKRALDDGGNPTIVYTCGVYKGATLNLGDVVALGYEALDIDVSLRVVSKTHDPYNPNNVTVEIGNYVNALEDDLYRIETSMVAQGAKYYGARISAEVGFESVRNDKYARAVFNADEFKMQTGDGSGSSWEDVLYFDAENKKWYFNGELSADIINALSVLISPNLYAEKATIAELTVDQLDTSTKVKRYLESSTADVYYIQIYEQYINLVTASTDGSDETQATDRNGEPLYWTDDTYTSASTDETDYPVMIYVYDEQVKRQIHFYDDGTNQIPRDVFGAGDTEGYDRFYIYKPANKAILEYFTPNTGKRSAIEFSEFVDAKLRRLKGCTINKSTGTVTIYMEGNPTPDVIHYTETSNSMSFEWSDGYVTDVAIV